MVSQSPSESIKSLTSTLQKVVIVGRPNAGKSTLFNRILGRRKAIVQHESGTTRDRVYGKVSWQHRNFTMIDTGGFNFKTQTELENLVNREIEKGIREAALVVFLCDGSNGLNPMDERLSEKLRRLKHKVIVCVNKLDEPKNFAQGDEFFKLGFQNLVKISALHGIGVDDLLDSIAKLLPTESSIATLPEDILFTLSIVGEPNVGKSTFFNALLNEERSIVSEVPGTTRDAVDEMIEYKNSRILLVDTAGLTKKRIEETPTAFFSMSRTKESIRNSQVILFVFDAQKGIGSTSKQILNFIFENKKCCILIANKWDKVKGVEQGKYRVVLAKKMPFISAYPVAFISAATKRNMLEPLTLALEGYERYNTWVKTSELNRFLLNVKQAHAIKGNVRLKFLTQIKTQPPGFLLFVRHSKSLKVDAIRFLRNQIQEHFNLWGFPVDLSIKEDE